MTEVEASKKWCPFARRPAGAGGGINRNADNYPLAFCIGNKCMAWKIETGSKTYKITENGSEEIEVGDCKLMNGGIG